MKNGKARTGTEFQNEIDAAGAWATRLRQLGPAAPRPEMAEHDRIVFCAGYLAAKAGR